MARWILGVVVAWFVFTGCAGAAKPAFRREVVRFAPVAQQQPRMLTEGQLLQPHRFLLACFEMVMATGAQPGNMIERDRKALVATFYCLFDHPRRVSTLEVVRFMRERAVEGMSVASRLELVRELARLWGIRFRAEFGGVLFLRQEMRPGYEGVDGVAFIMEGERVSINFVRLVERDSRSHEL